MSKTSLKLFLSLSIVSMVLLFSMTGCGSSSNKTTADNAGNKKYEWDYNLHVNTNEGTGVYMKKFADSVKEQTNGRLVITPHAPGELPYTGMESVRAVGKGAIQMADAPIGYIAGDVKETVIPTWPFLASKDSNTFKKAYKVVQPYADKELKKNGVETLFYLSDPIQRLWGVGKPVKKLSDLKGLKIRTFSPELQAFFKKLGATPVSMSFSEVPAALQRGVIDAAVTGSAGAYDAKWYELIDWGYTLPVAGSAGLQLVNSKSLNQLPDDIQKIVLKQAKEMEREGNQNTEKEDLEDIKRFEKKGVKINEASSEDIEKSKQIMKSLWDKWANESGPKMQEVYHKVLEATK